MGVDRVQSTKRGTCIVCNKSVMYGQMMRHVAMHVQRYKAGRYCILKVYSDSYFWFYIQVPESCTLRELDTFLRVAWLECCGHLSCFKINGAIYDIDAELARDYGTEDAKSMEYRMSSILKNGLKFEYEYDFGTTTILNLAVVATKIPPIVTGGEIQVVAVHDPVSFLCETCGKSADIVCGFCTIYSEGSILCNTCMEKHRCYIDEDGDEEGMLAVVQSPRVGMCAYEGPVQLYDRTTKKRGKWNYVLECDN